MTLELFVVAVVRIGGALPVLRWPFAGAIIAILVDLSDIFLRDYLDLGGLGDYQAVDKWLDQAQLLLFLVVALRWSGRPRNIAVALYAFRFVGFALFEMSGQRIVLVLFPNVFEAWFVACAFLAWRRPAFSWATRQTVVLLAACAAVKEVQELLLHGFRVFDCCSTIDLVDGIRRWLTGG